MQISQSVAKTIKDMAKKANVPVGQMLTECGISKNAMSSMQSGGYLPRIDNLVKIADYFECSVDYLLGRTDNPEAHKSQNSYVVNNRDTVVNGTQANVINNGLVDRDVLELVELIQSLPIVKRAEAILAVEEIKNKE